MRPFSGSASIGIINKTFIKNRFDNVTDGMMNNPISKWGSFYSSLFGIINNEFAITAMSIRFIA